MIETSGRKDHLTGSFSGCGLSGRLWLGAIHILKEEEIMKKILSMMIVAALLATCLPMMGAMAEEEKYTYTILTN